MKFKIFPPIGIARIGDSDAEWFIGPEHPGAYEQPPGGYKSADCKIKRQGARFRIFAYDDAGQPILENGRPKEITSAQAKITWTVQLGNTKAASVRFHPIDTTALRNPDVEEADRDTLRIVTEALTITGANQEAAFTLGDFRGVPVKLGDLRTDGDGRLIVLGGQGAGAAVHPGGALWPELGFTQASSTYDINDWYDDTSDGPVRALVEMDGDAEQALPARVVVAPPAYAPGIHPVVSLYDRLRQALVGKYPQLAPVGSPSFNRDIHPILRRSRDIGRLFSMQGHQTLAEAAMQPEFGGRGFIVSKLMVPGTTSPTSGNQAFADMPKLLDDEKQQSFPLTEIQYAAMKAWGAPDGDWINDWTGAPPVPDPFVTPDGLTQAALEACIGQGLRPGIEAGRFLLNTDVYVEPFRLSDALPPGEVTAKMAVPWQGDFYSCGKESKFESPNEFWGWWPTHRPDEVFPEAGGPQASWYVAGDGASIATGGLWLVENFNQPGFVVSKNGAPPVETERTIACRDLSFVILRDVISRAAVATALGVDGADKGRIPNVLTVRVGGCAPLDLGLGSVMPTEDEIAAAAPTLAFLDAGGPLAGIGYKARTIAFQKPTLALKQIVAFTYDLVFQTEDMFSAETRVVTVAGEKPWSGDGKTGVATGESQFTLTDIPAPYIHNGDIPWLSEDLKVFRVLEGQAPVAGLGPIGPTPNDARDYIAKLVQQFNQLPQGGHPFDALKANEQASALQLMTTEDGKPVYNFAVARVRYAGKAAAAEDVRVFFRLFTTAATGFAYDPEQAYRRSADLDAPVPLLGLDGSKYVISFPCFGRARLDSGLAGLSGQKDDLNVRTLQPPQPGQAETHAYFGCWIDVNQEVPQFPKQPVPFDGPWPGTGTDPNGKRQNLILLMDGEHQCLVAEVASPDRPIKPGVTPGGDGQLAQRNLVWVGSDNPGGPETRTVQHSFMLKAPARTPPGPMPYDQLVIHWRGLPTGCRMRVYMPDVEAGEVMTLAARTMDYPGIGRLDGHTLDCAPGDVTYIPIPPGRTRDVPALLTIELPEGVRKGQQFQAVVEQVSSARKVLGAFQLSIPVGLARAMLAPEERRLSLLRYILAGKAPDDPWRAVMLRYVDQVAARVRGFGGDPDLIGPSPSGEGKQKAANTLACRLLGGLTALATTALVVFGGLHPPPPQIPVLVSGALAVLLAIAWIVVCKPKPWRFLLMLGVGAAVGAGLLGVLALLGIAGSVLFTWLAAASALGALSLLAAAVLFAADP